MKKYIKSASFNEYDSKYENKSLCDTCLYKYSCESSDAGLSSANHLVCYGYAPVGQK